jgi:hypothetical protein
MSLLARWHRRLFLLFFIKDNSSCNGACCAGETDPSDEGIGDRDGNASGDDSKCENDCRQSYDAGHCDECNDGLVSGNQGKPTMDAVLRRSEFDDRSRNEGGISLSDGDVRRDGDRLFDRGFRGMGGQGFIARNSVGGLLGPFPGIRFWGHGWFWGMRSSRFGSVSDGETQLLEFLPR